MEGIPALDAERSPMLELLVIGNLECSLKHFQCKNINFLRENFEFVYKNLNCYILPNNIKDILFSGIFVLILAIEGNYNLRNSILNILPQELFITMVIVIF